MFSLFKRTPYEIKISSMVCERDKTFVWKNLPIYIINNINAFAFISMSEGFGINTDIFETNILNLSVVIGTLVYYGRAAFAPWTYI